MRTSLCGVCWGASLFSMLKWVIFKGLLPSLQWSEVLCCVVTDETRMLLRGCGKIDAKTERDCEIRTGLLSSSIHHLLTRYLFVCLFVCLFVEGQVFAWRCVGWGFRSERAVNVSLLAELMSWDLIKLAALDSAGIWLGVFVFVT